MPSFGQHPPRKWSLAGESFQMPLAVPVISSMLEREEEKKATATMFMLTPNSSVQRIHQTDTIDLCVRLNGLACPVSGGGGGANKEIRGLH